MTAGVPQLSAGDRLSRDEFERRYAAMPRVKKAERIEGVVYMPSPVTQARHGGPHARLTTWLGHYVAHTPGFDFGDNATVRLDLDSEAQPDLHLRLLRERGGRTRLGPEGYVEGAPELVVEVTASRASYDLHDKLRAYRRNGVREYLVWRVDDGAFDWLCLHGSDYRPLVADAAGIVRSPCCPGLWLDVPALQRSDLKAVLDCLEVGMKGPEHRAFCAAP